MWPSDLQSRLGEINRQRVHAQSQTFARTNRPTQPPEVGRKQLLSGDAALQDKPTDHAEPLLPPPTGLRGGIQQNEHGQHLWIKHPLERIWPVGAQWTESLLARWQDYGHLPEEAHEELDAVQRFFPERVFFLDLETCGFAGSMIFLAGLIHYDDHRLVLSQLWARNYAEETALLTTLWQIAQSHRVLVTFNGKSFDWTHVHDRSTLYRLGLPPSSKAQCSAGALTNNGSVLKPEDTRPAPVHCDLLHHARRRWKRLLPNCRLQTLERFVCGRTRGGDIPGREIPDAYHDYVRTGRTEAIKSILHHNVLDLVTLLQLTMQFVMAENQPSTLPVEFPVRRAG